MKLNESGWDPISEYPFDSAIKRMAVVYRKPTGEDVIYGKGAVERILERCAKYGPSAEIITEEHKEEILKQMSLLADQGFRVLALAQRSYPEQLSKTQWKDVSREAVEQDYTFLGLVGIYDPPRMETKDAIKACTLAGIQVHMLTGGKFSSYYSKDVVLTNCRSPKYCSCDCPRCGHYSKGLFHPICRCRCSHG